MKYKDKIDEILREVLYEDWLEEDEYQAMLEYLFQRSKYNYERINDNMISAMENGYDGETVLRSLAKLLSYLK